MGLQAAKLDAQRLVHLQQGVINSATDMCYTPPALGLHAFLAAHMSINKCLALQASAFQQQMTQGTVATHALHVSHNITIAVTGLVAS